MQTEKKGGKYEQRGGKKINKGVKKGVIRCVCVCGGREGEEKRLGPRGEHAPTFHQRHAEV